MILLIPVFLLLLSGIAVSVLRRLKIPIGYAWLVAAGAALLTWLFLLVAPLDWFHSFGTDNWIPIGDNPVSISFQLDETSWPYAIALGAVLFAVIVLSVSRKDAEVAGVTWGGVLGLGSLGIFTITAGSPLALVLAWTAIDFFELLVMVNMVEDRRLDTQAVLTFAFRIVGTLFVLLAMMLNYAGGAPLTFSNILPNAGICLLIAVGLRLGVLPLHLVFTQTAPTRRGLGTIMRFISPASSLVLVSRLPVQVITGGWHDLILIILSIGGLYGAVMWATSSDELTGRPFWLIASGTMALTCAINNNPTVSQVWGVTLLLAGVVLFLSFSGQRWLMVFPLLAAISLSGLPFTLTSVGWAGLIPQPFQMGSLIFILVVSLLIVGYARFAIYPKPEFSSLERMDQVVYPFGLAAPVLTIWIIFFKRLPGSISLDYWWASLAALGVSGLIAFISLRLIKNRQTHPAAGWLTGVFKSLLRFFNTIFSLDWIFFIIIRLYRLLGIIVRIIGDTLEGEAGVLWALILFIALITILRSGMAQ